jgi:hypothetical protein
MGRGRGGEGTGRLHHSCGATRLFHANPTEGLLILVMAFEVWSHLVISCVWYMSVRRSSHEFCSS